MQNPSKPRQVNTTWRGFDNKEKICYNKNVIFQFAHSRDITKETES